MKARKERENKERLEKGIIDPPSTIHKRFINRIFDSRKSHIVPENVRLMPLPDGSLAPCTRDQVMALGAYTVGALRSQQPDIYETTPCHVDAKKR